MMCYSYHATGRRTLLIFISCVLVQGGWGNVCLIRSDPAGQEGGPGITIDDIESYSEAELA